MSTALQEALILVCVAVVIFVLLLIPLAILFYRRASNMARQMEELNHDLKALIQDSRTLVQNFNLLSAHANKQMDELDKVVGVVRRWAERADYVVEEVGSAAKVPLVTVARSFKVLRRTWRLILGLFGEDTRQIEREAGETSRLRK